MEVENTAKERLDQIDSVLDEYESNLGLSSYTGDFHDQSVIQQRNGSCKLGVVKSKEDDVWQGNSI